MDIDKKWIIGGGLVLGVILLLRGGSAPKQANNTGLASQSIASNQDTTLGLAALSSQTAAQQSRDQLHAIISTNALAGYQSGLAHQENMSALTIGAANAIMGNIQSLANTTSGIAAEYTKQTAITQGLMNDNQTKLGIVGTTTRASVESQRINARAQVQVAQIQADAAKHISDNAADASIWTTFIKGWASTSNTLTTTAGSVASDYMKVA